MIEVFPVDSVKNVYTTVRFCALVDHNIVLSVETRGDGSEQKICQDIHACKKKNQCRYLPNPNARKI